MLRRFALLRTFRGRLALLYASLQLGISLLAGGLLYLALSHRVYQEVDEALLTQAESLAKELEHSPLPFWNGHLTSFANHYRDAIQLIAANGTIMFRYGPSLIDRGGNDVSRALAKAFNHDQVAYADTRSLLQRDNLRVIALPIHRDRDVAAVLLLGHGTNDIRSVFNLLYLLGGVMVLISILISAMAGYHMAKQALQPLKEITSTARAVAAGDLSRRLKSKSQDREIRMLVQVLNKMFADLEASFQAQKRFTADASHELRLPLTILKGEIEVALRHPRTVEEYQEILRQQLDTIDRIQRIVNDLLTLARADAGQFELVQTEVDLSLLLQEIGQQHLILFDSQHVRLDMDIEDGLVVMGDAAMLERCVMNLLNNAFKYAPERSTIYLRARAVDHSAIVSVRDEGPGIPEEKQPYLFDRFFRVDDARCHRESGGAGLGLAICKHIIDAHGGDIWVKSREGKGAEFFIRLPLAGPNPAMQNRLRRLLRKREPSGD